jgi:phosphoribosylformylglycinamidine synthase
MYLNRMNLVEPVPKFVVQVVIENKPYINDPEGETIHRDLVVKGGYSNVQSVRSAKMLKMVINSKSEKKLCEELRIFNPVVSNCTVKATGKYNLNSNAYRRDPWSRSRRQGCLSRSAHPPATT